jgi:hypothetical protein
MELSIKSYVASNKTLFEDVADEYMNVSHQYDTKYTILDYEKIMSDMIEYVQGYVSYYDSGSDKYEGKVIATTKSFYDSMFDNKTYRKTIVLSDFRDINKKFLEKTKELQDLLEKYSDDKTRTELCALCEMTDKQYRKLGKVYRDDMRIYLWLATSNSKVFNTSLDPELRSHFYDKSTPVMHEKKNDD